MTELLESSVVCSEMSRVVGEQLFGTCVRVDVWFLLEYTRAWGAKAFEESDLWENVKSWLNGQLKAVSNSRLHFIRQGNAHSSITFYVGISNEQTPRMYKFALDTYEDLLQLDMPAILSGDISEPINEKLYLVCTNGKRDRCCAKHGVPFYNAISEIVGESVWQTTHIAGHRFAATMLCFPHGLCYGRLRTDDARAVVEAYRSGQIIQEKFRGRSGYSPLAQAAEYYLREYKSNYGIDDLKLLDERDNSVDFEIGNWHYHVQLESKLSEWTSYQSCNAPGPEQLTQYFLKSIETVERM